MFSAALYAHVQLFVHYSHMRSRVQRASGIPCALCLMRAGSSIANLGRFATRECGYIFNCHRPPECAIAHGGRATQYSRDVND